MRHRKANKKLGRKLPARIALLRSLAIALIKEGRIKTTVARAKELSRFIDRVIVLSKRGDLSSRREALSKIPNKKIINELFAKAGTEFSDKTSGFTHIVRVGRRSGDNAEMALIYFKELEVG